MISNGGSNETVKSVIKNCTIVSTFEKPNSLKFELIFGNYFDRISNEIDDKNIWNSFDYCFLPGQIFGFSYESLGTDYKKLNHAFVARSCFPGNSGSIIPGINPGAEILVKTLRGSDTLKLRSILQKFIKNGVDLSALPAARYRHLNSLLETNSSTDFFIGERMGWYYA